MNSRFIPIVLISTLFVLLVAPPLVAEDAAPVEELPALVAIALANNPELKASEARWQMFTNRVRQVSALDDPMLMLKIQNGMVRAPLDFRRDSMTQKVIGISQQLPFWGKRGLKEEVAAKEAESYRWAVAERRLELARMVKESYYQLYAVTRALAIVANNLQILDNFIALAETRYSVGQGLQQDLLKAQLERSKTLDMQLSLEQQRTSLQANLNTLLYRPAETAVGIIFDPDTKPVSLTAAELRGIADANRPLIRGYQALVEKGEAGHRLARLERFPDVNLAFEYMQRDPAMGNEGDDMYSFGVTFNLPLQTGRRQAMAAESSSEATMAAAELANLRNSINYGIADLLAQLERRRKMIELYKTGIIPQAEQSLESATIGYRVNKVDFLTLLDSRVTLFNYEREYYESLAEYQMKRAQLEALIGKEL
jgi:cobalt-zinc-cadmium efflux system outer membrane protein